MLRRLAQYLIAVAILGVACGTYHWTFVAWLEPDDLPEITMAGSPVLRKDDGLASLFAPDSWQRGNCKRLQTRDGVLLFENWQQTSDDQWKLWPVSVVLGSNGDSPLVLDAVEGAEIKFTESLDVMSGGAPPIERGRMIGNVRIHSVDRRPLVQSREGQQKNTVRHIEIETSEVGIDHKKVWTTQPIRLQLGDAQLVGRDLTLHLTTTGGMIVPGDNALSVLDRLELIYLDELTVPLADGSLWGSAAPRPEKPKPPIDRPIPLGRQPAVEIAPPGLASMRCGGRVVFQFATGELTLVERVELRHQGSIQSPTTDTFVCDQMQLKFADLLAKRQRGDELQNYLLSLIADGNVRAALPSFDAQLAAGRLRVDTRAQQIALTGGVLVSYAGNRWQFQEVNYLINPVDPKQLGAFDAPGIGSMDVATTLDVPVKRLRWEGGIKLEPIEGTRQLSLRIDGGVSAAMTDGGNFKSDSALLVVEQGTEPESKSSSNDAGMNLIPKRFQATGQVLLETPVIAVATRLLQLYFEVEPNGAAITNAPKTDTTAQGNDSLRRWVKQPGEETPTTRLATNSTPVARSRPTIHGDTINAKLRLSGGNVTARDLNVVGDVALRHEIQTQSGMLPAVLTGDRLLLSDGGGNDVLQIGSGIDRPARFDLGDGYFIGPLIQVRMADNVVWIKDAGEFRMPTQVLPRVGAISAREGMAPIGTESNLDIDQSLPTPSKLEWVSAPRCRWKGQMVFDGRTAVLTDGVDLHATVVNGDQRDVWDMHLVGDQLQLVLDQDVRVREVESVKAATIDHISITGSAANPLLVTANQVNAAGSRMARHVLAAPQLILKPQAGTLSGPGPGWYRAWMQSGQSAPFGQLTNSAATTSPTAANESMFGVHLIYEETLEANMKSQSLDFLRGVRIAGRNVATWDDVIDVTQMQGLRLSESTLDCDRLRLAIDGTRQWVPAAQKWEMEAIGNVAFGTRMEKGLFNGTANRASYAAAKDIFLIEGLPGRAAQMNQTLPTGQPGWSANVKHMTVNPKTMEVQNVEFDSLQLGTLPSSLSP